MIRIAPNLSLNEDDLVFQFIRASGPGGQNVNKVATAVQLRYDTTHLPEVVRNRLPRIAGRRLTQNGELLLEARRFRTQERNRQDAIERLVTLLQRALETPKPRKPTRPTLGSKKRRLESKTKRGRTKQLRGKPSFD